MISAPKARACALATGSLASLRLWRSRGTRIRSIDPMSYFEPPTAKARGSLPLLWGVEPSTTRSPHAGSPSDPDSRCFAQPTGSDARTLVALSPAGDCDPGPAMCPAGTRGRSPRSGPGACDGTTLCREYHDSMPRVPRRTWPVKRVGLKPLTPVNADRCAIARLKHLGFTAYRLKPWAPAPEGRAIVVRYKQVEWREREEEEPTGAKTLRGRPRHH